jgi:hypothetical protein
VANAACLPNCLIQRQECFTSGPGGGWSPFPTQGSHPPKQNQNQRREYAVATQMSAVGIVRSTHGGVHAHPHDSGACRPCHDVEQSSLYAYPSLAWAKRCLRVKKSARTARRLTQPHKPGQPATSRHLPLHKTCFLFTFFPTNDSPAPSFRPTASSIHRLRADRPCKRRPGSTTITTRRSNDTSTGCLTLIASAPDRAVLESDGGSFCAEGSIALRGHQRFNVRDPIRCAPTCRVSSS